MAESGIIKIGVLGAESTGKTWLCEALAREYNTVFVTEYAREYFNTADIYNYTSDDLGNIAKRQVELEKEMLSRARRFLFCDTTCITLKIWSELEFEMVPDIIRELVFTNKYHFYLINDNTVPWVEDELRQNKHSRDVLMTMNETEVKKTGIPYSIVSGEKEDRLRNAIKAIEHMFAV